jgi:hypothetical protein
MLLCGILTSTYMFAGGQAQSDCTGLGDEVSKVDRQVFITCPGGRIFSNLKVPLAFCTIGTSKTGKHCYEVLEFGRTHRNQPQSQKISAAAELNGVTCSVSVTMDYGATRSRSVLDDAWGPWDDWGDPQGDPGNAYYIYKQKGVWSADVGTTISKVPFSVDDNMGPNLACSDLLNNAPHRQDATAAGHSLQDSYQRTMQITQQNRSKGIVDPLDRVYNSLPPRPVCSSITPGRPPQCIPTGEVVRVPGDLNMPPAFWDRSSPSWYYVTCGGPSRNLGLEIKLNGQTDDRKRYIDCITATFLADRRQMMVDAGVH